uniref:Uncharacterized protein n=1 Tax=Arundo donax TaxID=35708 RepID=A0A0A9F331_ARUDO
MLFTINSSVHSILHVAICTYFLDNGKKYSSGLLHLYSFPAHFQLEKHSYDAKAHFHLIIN